MVEKWIEKVIDDSHKDGFSDSLISFVSNFSGPVKDSAGNYEDQSGVYGFGAKIRNGRGSEVSCSQEHDSGQYAF